MENTKLSNLLNRFENYVDVAETAQSLSTDAQLAKFEALVIRLEKARASAPVQAAPAQASAAPSGGGANYAAEFKANCFKNVEALRAATKVIAKEPLTGGVEAYLEYLNAQELVMLTMGACCKPADNGGAMRSNKFWKAKYDAIRNFGGPKFRKEGVSLNLRVVEDSLDIFKWWSLGGQSDKEAKEHLQEWAGNIDIKGQELEGGS